MSTYIIDLKALTEDVKTFTFKLNDEYFKNLDAEALGGNVECQLCVKRTSGAFELTFDMQGSVIVPCDRCLDDMSYPVSTQSMLKVKFGEEYNEEDDLITVAEDEGTLDVEWLMYEIIDLSLPIKREHEEGECNAEMMEILSQHLALEAEPNEEENI